MDNLNLWRVVGTNTTRLVRPIKTCFWISRGDTSFCGSNSTITPEQLGRWKLAGTLWRILDSLLSLASKLFSCYISNPKIESWGFKIKQWSLFGDLCMITSQEEQKYLGTSFMTFTHLLLISWWRILNNLLIPLQVMWSQGHQNQLVHLLKLFQIFYSNHLRKVIMKQLTYETI